MKKNYFITLVLTFLISGLIFSQDLIITGVFDGSLSGGTPKGVELYVLNDIADLSIYGIGSANNGGGTDGEEYEFPADAVTAGSYIYVTANTAEFNTFFGFAASYDAGSAMAINGDDAVELFMNDAVIDVFGDINVDGNGETWEYLDGWAYRKNGKTITTTFADTDWTYSGVNGLEGGTNNATASSPMPIGTYTTVASTEPTLAITSPTSGEKNATTTIDVNITLENFTLSANNGSDLGDNSGDGFIKSIFETQGGSTETASFFTSDLPDLTVTPGNTYTLTLELVDNSGASLGSPIVQSVTFSVKFPCSIQLTTIDTTCDNLTTGTDTYQAIIDFTDGNTGTTYTITAKDENDADVGTISGDDPSNVATGQITISGIPEGTNFTLKVVGGQGSSCNFTRNIFSPTCLPAPTCPAAGSIIITEIMQNPNKVSDNNGEYFEVYNTTSEPINLLGWVLKTSSGTGNPVVRTITTSVEVPANGYFVLGENSDISTNGGVNVDYQYDSGLFLGNGDATVTIECSASIFDSVSYDNGTTFPDPNGKSMELATNKYSASDNDNGANWAEATSEIVSGGDLGTPGKANDFVLSLDRNSILGFATYPNPITSKSFTISSSSSDLKEISIFNVIGKKVFATSFSGVKKDIDVSSINAGVYILKVTEAGKTATKKLVIR
ncbi:lamin tail domain-containing protein [Polaribacter septentrionalilitoris]|uniref:lamin tail domain-containing protein n=1 Tax=Polaribacter septentrionalilitoris TaxID=2494657 RepID=UPI00135760C7|nr:lamin tail domain-containing protein [Polaribacter septentrionalilitoris]